jgi:pimeloyl-ACP methyl ester carboxylesterase
MATAIAMPKLGMTMEEGRVVAWPIPLGGRVAKGRPVLVIESEKTEAEIEATAAGVLRHIYVPVDETVPCGTLLAALTEDAEEPFDPVAFAESFRRRAPAPIRPAPKAPAPGPPARPPGAAPPRRPVAPAARALARELAVDLEAVAGTGPGGRVVREDVALFAEARSRLRRASGPVSLEVPSEGTGMAVVLLPGFGTDVSSFAPQIPALAERFSVLGVNPRGVGLSDAPPLPAYDVATAAADVASVAPERFHLVGASLGAAVALEVALAHPGRVGRLALITPFVEAGPRLLAVLDLWCRAAAETRADTLARILLPWLFSESFLADERARERTLRGLARSVARVPAPTLARTAAGLRAWSGTRGKDLGRIVTPTLVVGAGQDLLTPDTGQLADALPRCRFVTVESSGHAVALESPEEVSEVLGAHLSAT